VTTTTTTTNTRSVQKSEGTKHTEKHPKTKLFLLRKTGSNYKIQAHTTAANVFVVPSHTHRNCSKVALNCQYNRTGPPLSTFPSALDLFLGLLKGAKGIFPISCVKSLPVFSHCISSTPSPTG